MENSVDETALDHLSRCTGSLSAILSNGSHCNDIFSVSRRVDERLRLFGYPVLIGEENCFPTDVLLGYRYRTTTDDNKKIRRVQFWKPAPHGISKRFFRSICSFWPGQKPLTCRSKPGSLSNPTWVLIFYRRRLNYHFHIRRSLRRTGRFSAPHGPSMDSSQTTSVLKCQPRQEHQLELQQ